MSRKIRLTPDQHAQVADTIRDVCYWLFLASKTIIESYGWSSRVGKKSESFILTLYPSNKLFFRLKFSIIDSIYERPGDFDPVEVERLYAQIPLDDRCKEAQIMGKLPYPHKMTESQHTQVADWLRESRQAMQSLGIDILQKAYPKNSSILKTCFRIVDRIDDLRCDLDSLFVREHPRDYLPYSPYYGKKEASTE